MSNNRGMLAQLVAVGGPLHGATVALTEGETTVGRDDANLLALADQSVSLRHCVIAVEGEDVTLRDVDGANPSFINGLPCSGVALRDGDQIQIGGSLFVLKTRSSEEEIAFVRVQRSPTLPRSTIVMRREDVLATDHLVEHAASSDRVARDLAALIRISAAVSSVRGLVALERPLIELLTDLMAGSRGAIVLATEHSIDAHSDRAGFGNGVPEEPIHVSGWVLDRVLRDAVGILSDECSAGDAGGWRPRSVLAAPLIAFEKPVGAVVLEVGADRGRFDVEHLRLVMAIAGIAATAFEHAKQIETLEGTNRQLRAELNVEHNMVGESRQMRAVYQRIALVAPTDSTVLITGESGTGKELVARAIHRNSPRAARPFVAINCAAITESLLESELFGHEKGAFTGAIAQKRGRFELADGGSVFLDEIGELSLALQAKLLRALQEHAFERVGGTKAVSVDFRLVAATNRDLGPAMAAGQFRRDLYYRLNVVSVHLPPLRERRADIPLLAAWFVRRHSLKAKRSVSGFAGDALACLTAYDWPGNVRELENAIEHAVVLGGDTLIRRDDLPDAVADATSSEPVTGAPTTLRFREAIKRTKSDLVMRAMTDADGNYGTAATLLGLHPNYLHRLIKNLNLKAALRNLYEKAD